MVGSCIARGCKNQVNRKPPGCTFHRFPKSEKRRTAWERAIRRDDDDWKSKHHHVICSVHFEDHMFDRTGQTTRLREDAEPSIFPAFPKYLQKGARDRTPTQKLLSSTEMKKKTPEVLFLNGKQEKTLQSTSSNEKPKQTLKSVSCDTKRKQFLKSVPNESERSGTLMVSEDIVKCDNSDISLQDSCDDQLTGPTEPSSEVLRFDPASQSFVLFSESMAQSREEIEINRLQNELSAKENTRCAIEAEVEEEDCDSNQELPSNLPLSVTLEVRPPDPNDPFYQSFLRFSASLEKSKADMAMNKITNNELPSIDHNYNRNPGSLQKKYEQKCRENENLRKRLKISYQRIRRMTKKMNNLVNVIEGLDRDMIEDILIAGVDY